MNEFGETIQLTTVMGIHACNLAIPILMEETEGLDDWADEGLDDWADVDWSASSIYFTRFRTDNRPPLILETLWREPP